VRSDPESPAQSQAEPGSSAQATPAAGSRHARAALSK